MKQEAIEKIKDLANSYKPKNDANWICFYASDCSYSETYEPTNSETYCEDCIEETIEKLKNDTSTVLPKNFESFTYDTETSKEGEDFCRCSECGEIIHQSVIFTSQEIEHWLSLSDKEFSESLKNNHSCYELLELITDEFIDKKHEKAVQKIIKRILK